ncbi:hypothetical protein LCGC14_2139930 [marine sediment metagenome]|uniref:HK97 gp10 family phage protein n=1 Tax=marine sediment metagenome TaxID=412755 RepID=A0A0F9DYY9_9ZZZZ
MVARRVRFRVGRQRLTSGVDTSTAGYTRQIRSQMKSIEQSYTRFLGTVEATTEVAVRTALQPVFDRSQELVPVDTGKLKASGYLETRVSRGRVVGEVGYGRGGNPHWAPRVHEDLDVFHEPPTQAKYLEQAANEHAAGMLDVAGTVYRQTLGL